MFGLIALGLAGATGIYGHIKSKEFVRKRLRYTKFVERPGMGLLTGAATAIVAAPLVAALPILGLGTGIAVGVAAGFGVGTGVAAGASQAKSGVVDDDDY